MRLFVCLGRLLATIFPTPLDRREGELFPLVVTVVVLRIQWRSANAEKCRADLLEVEDARREPKNTTGDDPTIDLIRRTHKRDLVGVVKSVVGGDELRSRHPQLREDVVAGLVLFPPCELTRSVGRAGLHPAEMLMDDVLWFIVLVRQVRSRRAGRVHESCRKADVDLTRHLGDGRVTKDEVEDFLDDTALVATVVDAAHPHIRPRGKEAISALRILDVVDVVLMGQRRVDLDVAGGADGLLERIDHELAVRAGQMGIRALLVADGIARRDAAVDEEVDVRSGR